MKNGEKVIGMQKVAMLHDHQTLLSEPRVYSVLS